MKYEVESLKYRASEVMDIKTPKLQLIARILNDVEGLGGAEYLELTAYLMELDQFIQNPLTTALCDRIRDRHKNGKPYMNDELKESMEEKN
tara:strand:- start:1438 stop:1710 length:273 start_codon:yes stop_codon:yes gene_type:complete